MTTSILNKLPTLAGYLERRREKLKNRLPKHLRPLPRWPIYLQLALNAGIFIALASLLINKDDFVTDAGPAVVMVVCLLLLIYTLINAFHLRHTYTSQIAGHRWAKANFWLMWLAFLMFPICVATFLR